MVRYRPGVGSTALARKLRTDPTEAEKRMWTLLRENFPEARFRRQAPIRSYVADFASHRSKLVIEVDGGQHNAELDNDRTAAIEAEGYRLLRFWNNEVLENPAGVLTVIASALADHHPHPTLPHQGGGPS